jgi:hypothetical protein
LDCIKYTILKKQPSYRTWILLILGAYLFFALSNHISVADGQLGYLIKEGALFCQQGKILLFNSFTYTSPDYAVINNHWLAATSFYLLKQVLGFGGLHILVVLLYLSTFLIFFSYFAKFEYPLWTFLVGLLVVPTFGTHNVVESVLFSHCFAPIFFLILHQFLQDKRTVKWVYALPVLQLIWANCHEYFFIGWGLLFFAFLHAILHKKEKTKILGSIFIISIFVCFLNPNFANGVFAALKTAFSSHQLLPIWERNILDAYLFTKSYVFLYVLVGIICCLLGLFLYLKIEFEVKFFLLSTTLLFLFFTFWNSQLAPFLGISILLIALPVGEYYISKGGTEKLFLLSYKPPVLVLYIVVPVFFAANFWKPISNWGYGLRDEETEIIDFVNQTKIAGPYFHNTSISGLLAYGIEEEQALFISSQPLAHPDIFYTTNYFPQILDPLAWKNIHDEYLFNAIIFRVQGESKRNLEFMGNLLGNGKWAMVYYKKDYEVVLVKRNETNQAIINQFEITPNL